MSTAVCDPPSTPMVRMLYAACRDVATPVVQGTDVGRLVVDNPVIAVTNPTGLCVWWGLHRLWTLGCQKAARRREVGTLSVVMAMGVTFTEARAWFSNIEQPEATQTTERLSTADLAGRLAQEATEPDQWVTSLFATAPTS